MIQQLQQILGIYLKEMKDWVHKKTYKSKDFKSKKVIKNKEGHYLLIKVQYSKKV